MIILIIIVINIVTIQLSEAAKEEGDAKPGDEEAARPPTLNYETLATGFNIHRRYPCQRRNTQLATHSGVVVQR